MDLKPLDRFIRIIVGGAIVLLGSYFPMHELVLWGLTILGILIMLSGLSGYCPYHHWRKIKASKKLPAQ